jgi:predicted transposase/invertase (TIGR01784 family)
MPKFKKEVHELSTHFEKWLYVLRNLNKLDRIPEELKESIFEQLFERAEIAKFSREEAKEYEDSLKTYRDIKNSIDTARDEGIEIGIEKGIEKGMEKGKIETAKLMLSEDEPIEKIIKFTGLTKEQIEKLK